MTDSIYKATAETLEPCQVNFVRKDDLLRLLQNNAEASFSALKQLSRNYSAACAQICSFGLSNSIADRLIKLLLEWCKTASGESDGTINLKVAYTHQDIAEMIGTTRETVSRLLKNLKDRDLIKRKGSNLIVHDIKKLEALIGNHQNMDSRRSEARF
jgi:CRP/FNR family transcriptional regulator